MSSTKIICTLAFIFICCLICPGVARTQDAVKIDKHLDYATKYEIFEAMGIFLGQAAPCSPPSTITQEMESVYVWLQKTSRSTNEANTIFKQFKSGIKIGLDSRIIDLAAYIDSGMTVNEATKKVDEKCNYAKEQYKRVVLIP